MTRRAFLVLVGFWLFAALMVPLPFGRWVLLLALIWLGIATLPMLLLALLSLMAPVYVVTVGVWIVYLLYRGLRHLLAGRERKALGAFGLALSIFAPVAIFATIIATMPALGS